MFFIGDFMIGKIVNKKAGVIVFLLGVMLLTPNITATTLQSNRKLMNVDAPNIEPNLDITKTIDNMRYIPTEDFSFAGEQNDIGYNVDSGDTIVRSIELYAGEPVEERIPGKGRTGSLEPSDGDSEDWYRFTVCAGQSIQASITTSQSFNCEIHNSVGDPVGTSYTAEVTGRHFIRVYTEEQSDGDYTMSITISGQNDAGTGSDAGDDIASATVITPGFYTGYMDYQDVEDWYA